VSFKTASDSRQRIRKFLLTADNLLPPTFFFDSDTISSHDKKRYYLECLEQYITYLHEQLRLVGHEPVALERVSTYRGLTSRSIRVFLVIVEAAIRPNDALFRRCW
jgi:hypothetical protein